MKKVGEVNLNQIPSIRMTREQLTASNRVGREKTTLICRDCKKEFSISVSKLKRWGENIKCYDCHQKGKDDMNKALIALARRKGLID